MTVTCIVCCRVQNLNRNLIFHRFPKNDSRKKEWCSRMGLPLGKAIKGWRICSLHFTDDSYMEPVLTGGSKLKKDAVPSIIDIYENSEETCETIQDIAKDENELDTTMVVNNEVSLESQTCSEKTEKILAGDADDIKIDIRFTNIKKVKWEHIKDSPNLTKAALDQAKETINNLQKKLKVERCRNWRTTQKIKTFKSLMKDLREQKFLTATEVNKMEVIFLNSDTDYKAASRACESQELKGYIPHSF